MNSIKNSYWRSHIVPLAEEETGDTAEESVLDYQTSVDRPLSDYYGTLKLPPKTSENGYLTINFKVPSSVLAKFPILKNAPVGGGLIIDLDDGSLGAIRSIGPDFMAGVTWTPGEPISGTDWIAEQYIVVGTTASRNGSNSIGLGWGGGFAWQQTKMFNDP